jgi:hypothetical protein
MRSVSQYSNNLGDLVPAEPEDNTVFVVVALTALCEDITAYLGDHKIAFSDEVHGPAPGTEWRTKQKVV